MARAAAIVGASASIVGAGVAAASSAAGPGLPTLTARPEREVGRCQRSAPVRGDERRRHRDRQAHRARADPPQPGSAVLGLRPGRGGDQRPSRRSQLPRPVRLDRVRRQRRQGNHQRPDDAAAGQLPGRRSEQPQTRPPARRLRDRSSGPPEVPPHAGRDDQRDRLRLPRPAHAPRRRARAIREPGLPRAPDPGDRRQEREERQAADRPASGRQRQGGPAVSGSASRSSPDRCHEAASSRSGSTSGPASTSSPASCAPRTAGNRPSSAWSARSASGAPGRPGDPTCLCGRVARPGLEPGTPRFSVVCSTS